MFGAEERLYGGGISGCRALAFPNLVPRPYMKVQGYGIAWVSASKGLDSTTLSLGLCSKLATSHGGPYKKWRIKYT